MLMLIILLPALLGLSVAFFKQGSSKGQIIYMFVLQLMELALVVAVALGKLTFQVFSVKIAAILPFTLDCDALGAFFMVLTAFTWLLTIPYSYKYMKHEGKEPLFYAFLFLTEAAVMGIALSGDFIAFYVFFELTTLFSFPLILHDRKLTALSGAAKYLYYSVGGAFIALFGLAVLYINCSSLTFTKGGTLLVGHTSPIVMAAILCVCVGFGAKAGLYPLHNWLTAAHPVAPGPASALLSGIIAKAGVIAIIRVLYNIAGVNAVRGTWVQYTLLTIALIGIFSGSFLGCLENVLKKRLAYSSISQISYVLVGIFMLTEVGTIGALLQLLFHALSKIGAFQCAGAVILLTGCTRVDQLRGVGRRIPWVMICFTLLSLSLIGIPPFGGFWSKWYLAQASLSSLPGFLGYLVPAILLASALLTAGYLFQPVIKAFFPGHDCPRELLEPVKQPAGMLVSLTILAGLCGILGFMPNAVIHLMQSIASSLL